MTILFMVWIEESITKVPDNAVHFFLRKLEVGIGNIFLRFVESGINLIGSTFLKHDKERSSLKHTWKSTGTAVPSR